MINLAAGHCIPCRSSEPPLTAAEIEELMFHVPQWQIVDREGIPTLQRVFKFKDFVEAVAFTSRVAALAEEQGHHPLIVTEWGRVTVQWWTHVLKALHRNDFIMAAKTDELLG